MWRAHEAPAPRTATPTSSLPSPPPPLPPLDSTPLQAARPGSPPAPTAVETIRLEIPRAEVRPASSRAARRAAASRSRWLVAGSAALAGTIVFAVLTNGGDNARSVEMLLPSLDAAAQWAGLGLDQASILGHRFTPDGDIFDALALDRERTLVGFDGDAAKARIEKLPWVLSADLTREYPGRLDIRITERTAFAVWRLGDRETLIDQTGRVLQAVPPGSVTNLPRVAGETADREAGTLLALVGRTPVLAQSLTLGERVGGRRWSLHLADGSRIELPSEGEALALDDLTANRGLDNILARGPHIVDLRARGRVAVRPLPHDERANRVSNLAAPLPLHVGGVAP